MNIHVADGAGRGGKLAGTLVGAIAVTVWFFSSSGEGAPPRQVTAETDRAAPQAWVEDGDVDSELDVRWNTDEGDVQVWADGPVRRRDVEGGTSAAAVTIVFNNFAAGDGYAAGGGWTINLGAGGPNKNWDQGPGFSPSATGTLTDVWLAVVLTSGVNELDVWLMNDVAGLPGAIIHSMHFSGQMGSFFANPPPPPLHWNGVGPTIFAGTQYYLIASATGPDMQGAFRTNTIGDIGPRAKRRDFGAWSVTNNVTRGAIRIGVGASDPCQDPNAGPCCEPNGTAGCNDQNGGSLCADVCGTQPSCCDPNAGWDPSCVDLMCQLFKGFCAPQDCSPCGDGFCDFQVGEDSCNCSQDCPPSCGDGCCDSNAGEDTCNCAADCGGAGTCGDGICCAGEGESPCTCLADCPGGCCGDGQCLSIENCSNCLLDCTSCGDGCCDLDFENPVVCPGDCPVECGDGFCSHNETDCPGSCPLDCSPVCGDGCCTGGETAGSCPGDCAGCGDGQCIFPETFCNCAADCGPSTCGDGCCDPEGGEDTCTCPGDCGVGTCNDGICCASENEDTCSCPGDCGVGTCNDGICCTNQGEDTCTCPGDCEVGTCGDGICCAAEGESTCTCVLDCDNFCGDGCCNGGEDLVSCAIDCSVCGDGACTGFESACDCPQDCPPSCGDECCTGNETPANCQFDCFCGDGLCTLPETSCTCSSDCGPSTCGDGTCCASSGEDSCNCPTDCGASTCGDGCCDSNASPPETRCNCPQDCFVNCCGDGACVGAENATNCPADCEGCGNGECSASEDSCSCPADCGVSTCGDGACCPDEDECSCPTDCGGGSCGDGICCADAGEDSCSCLTDCPGPCCGDGECEAGEDCPEDCATGACCDRSNGSCQDNVAQLSCNGSWLLGAQCSPDPFEPLCLRNDCQPNGTADDVDIDTGTSQDCNGNGIPDECDIASGRSRDCQSNGIPDECELFQNDCDGNRVPDECDADCQPNGVPDACDITNGTSVDCNANGKPDECEPDCNDNGIADECDIRDCPNRNPDCDDCNNNNVPDLCDIRDCPLTDSSCKDVDPPDGIPDKCSIWVGNLPQNNARGSGGNELWNAADNWRPPGVPDNAKSRPYSVVFTSDVVANAARKSDDAVATRVRRGRSSGSIPVTTRVRTATPARRAIPSAPIPAATPVVRVGSAPRAFGPGVMVYANDVTPQSYFPPRQDNILIMDDVHRVDMDNPLGYSLNGLSGLFVFSDGTAAYDMTVELWTDDGTGLVPVAPIPGTLASFQGVSSGAITELAWTYDTPISLPPGVIWIAWGISDGDSGPIIADEAETGFTDDFFWQAPPGDRFTLSGSYAGFSGRIFATENQNGGGLATVILNIDAAVDSFASTEAFAVNITQGNLTIATSAGISNGGELNVANGFSINSAGPIVLEAAPSVPQGGKAIEPKMKVADLSAVSATAIDAKEGTSILMAGTGKIDVKKTFSLTGKYQKDPDTVGESFAELKAGDILITTKTGLKAVAIGEMTVKDKMIVTVTADPLNPATTGKLRLFRDGTGIGAASASLARPQLRVLDEARIVAEILEASDAEVKVSGRLLPSGLPNITISGLAKFDAFASYLADPDRIATTSAVLEVGSLSATNGALIGIEDDMILRAVRSGSAEASTAAIAPGTISIACDDAAIGLARGGCVPPRLLVAGNGKVASETMIVGTDGLVEVSGRRSTSGQTLATGLAAPSIAIRALMTIDGGTYRAALARIDETDSVLSVGSFLIVGDGLVEVEDDISIRVTLDATVAAADGRLRLAGAQLGAGSAGVGLARPQLVVRERAKVVASIFEAVDADVLMSGELASIAINGPATFEASAIFRRESGTTPTSALFSAGSLLIADGATVEVTDKLRVRIASLSNAHAGAAAIAAGTIRIACDDGAAGSARGGCLPPLLLVQDEGTVVTESMILAAGQVAVSGQTPTDGTSNVQVSDLLTIKGLAFYQADPLRPAGTNSSSSLVAGSVLLTTDDVCEGGRMILPESLSVETGGDFVLSLAANCSGLLRGLAAPPRLVMSDSASLVVGGSFIIGEGTAIDLTATTAVAAGSQGQGLAVPTLTLRGNFDNLKNDSLTFEMETASVSLDGTNQTFEVAGVDRGGEAIAAIDNFTMGTVDIKPGASVTFVDNWVNNVAGLRANSGGGPTAEALYVRKLIFGSQSTVVVDGVTVYHGELVDGGANVTLRNGGQLLPLALDVGCTDSTECDDGDFCTFDRCLGNACSHASARYGDVAGVGGTCGPDGDVTLVDILAVLNAFGGGFADECALLNLDIAGSEGSCTPNGSIDLSDIIAVLDAFQGVDACCAGGG